jgi:hypothetical protein
VRNLTERNEEIQGAWLHTDSSPSCAVCHLLGVTECSARPTALVASMTAKGATTSMFSDEQLREMGCEVKLAGGRPKLVKVAEMPRDEHRG